jgi:hypothetical protein
VANSYVLTYNSGTSTWVASAAQGGSITTSAKTANYTLTTSDQLVTFSGSNLTATVPDPTTCSGTVLRVKNLNTSNLTVVSAGSSKTIDGAASVLVLQYRTLELVSNGTTWHSLAGNDLTPTSNAAQVTTTIASSEPAFWVKSEGSNRPAFRATVNSGSGAIFQGGQFIGGGFYTMFNVNAGGTITRLSNSDFTIATSSSNPQDNIVAGTYGLVVETGAGLLFQKKNNTGSYWPAWNFHPVGFTSNLRTETANYTVDCRDSVIIGNGSSITITLPDPTSTGITGRKFEIKNTHSTALTVVSAGSSKTIDGQASTVLTQWDKMTVVTNGTQWLIVEGKKSTTVSATAPTNPVEGDVWFDIS